MLKKILTIFLLISSFQVSSEGVTDKELEQFAKNWNLLMPENAYDFIPEKLNYKLLTSPDFQAKIAQANKQTNPALEGEIIELAGFMVPIETKGTKVTKFLLVPEAGQCIHVPPPPLNQTLLVNSENHPTKLRDIYEPIVVSGRLSVGAQSFDLSNSNIADPNQDAMGSVSYDTVESGYSLTQTTVKALVFEQSKDD